MRRRCSVIGLMFCLGCLCVFAAAASADDQEMVTEIFRTALAEGRSYQLLGELCERYPHRLSGSPESDAANLWAKKVMQDRGLEVRLQEVMVPYWGAGRYDGGGGRRRWADRDLERSRSRGVSGVRLSKGSRPGLSKSISFEQAGNSG